VHGLVGRRWEAPPASEHTNWKPGIEIVNEQLAHALLEIGAPVPRRLLGDQGNLSRNDLCGGVYLFGQQYAHKRVQSRDVWAAQDYHTHIAAFYDKDIEPGIDIEGKTATQATSSFDLEEGAIAFRTGRNDDRNVADLMLLALPTTY